MLKIKTRFISAVMTVAVAVTAAFGGAVSATEESIAERAKTELKIGSSYNLAFKEVDSFYFYKITVPVSGSLTVSYECYFKYGVFQLGNSDGTNIRPTKFASVAGHGDYRTIAGVGYFTTWDTSSEKAVGTITYKIDSGTYYLVAKRDDIVGLSDLKLGLSLRDINGQDVDANGNISIADTTVEMNWQRAAAFADKTYDNAVVKGKTVAYNNEQWDVYDAQGDGVSDSGYRHLIFKRGNDIIVAFRGMELNEKESRSEVLYNYLMGIGSAEQLNKVNRFVNGEGFKSLLDNSNYNIYIVGHSYGGCLSFKAYYDILNIRPLNANVKAVYTFNAIGSTNEIYQALNVRSHIYNYVTCCDIAKVANSLTNKYIPGGYRDEQAHTISHKHVIDNLKSSAKILSTPNFAVANDLLVAVNAHSLNWFLSYSGNPTIHSFSTGSMAKHVSAKRSSDTINVKWDSIDSAKYAVYYTYQSKATGVFHDWVIKTTDTNSFAIPNAVKSSTYYITILPYTDIPSRQYGMYSPYYSVRT